MYDPIGKGVLIHMLIFRKLLPDIVASSRFNFRQILLSGVFLVFTFSQASLGCSKEEIKETKVTSIRMDLRSELIFDQTVEFKENKKNEKNTSENRSSSDQNLRRSRQKKLLDPRFQAINRFEQPIVDYKRELMKEEDQEMKSTEVTGIQDRKLIFTGKGFAIRGFEAILNGKLNTDFYYHVRPSTPEDMKKLEPEHLDLRENNLRLKKNLIFKQPVIISESKDILLPDESESNISRSKKRTISNERVPQTKVLMTQEPKEIIKFYSGKNSLDLLLGDEKFNIGQFKNH